MRLIPFSVHRIQTSRNRVLPCIELLTDDFGNEIDLDVIFNECEAKADFMLEQAMHFMESRFYDRFVWTLLQDEETDPTDAYRACVVH
jgi:hypothetical protein